MGRIRSIFVTLLGVALLAACGSRSSEKENKAEAEGGAASVSPQYAQGYNVKCLPDGTVLLDISDPQGKKQQTYHFALVKRGSEGTVPEGYEKIETPIRSAVCMTSLQLSNFLKLGIPELVTGITSTRHLHNGVMKDQLKSGITHKIGIEGNFDSEVVMALQPDIILISPFKRGGYEGLANLGIPMLPHLGYKELSPLGQAEWIKVVGLLTGKEKEANEQFAGIEKRYNELKALVDTGAQRPKVMSGEVQNGHWYAPGGKSFLANLFKDAGADYFLSDNGESGGVTVDFEQVYVLAEDADYWRLVNSFEGDFSYKDLLARDKRYGDFAPFKKRGLVYCNMKQVPYYESMPVEPEEVLADFIAVFHPEVLPDHKPKYYHLVK